ncbi:MAG: hypothetical protein H0T72_09085 [Chloroflexia bacterium]|jgi:hypothetical protein|nr:hypothetical protein [Chloroflexia bacterium]
MNVKEGLEEIRGRLIRNGANPKSLQVVDAIMQRASLPAAQSASAGSLTQMVRMLMRSPVADADPIVYNDFVKVEEELEVRSEEFRVQREAEDAKPIPKTKKFYKAQKEKS